MTLSALDRLLDRPTRTDKVTFAFDPADADAWRELRRQVDDAEYAVTAATKTDASNATEARRRIREAEDALAEHRAALDEFEATVDTVTFELQAIGSDNVEDLMDKFPPSKEEKARHERAILEEGNGASTYLRYSDRHFPPALVAASLVRLTLSTGETTDEINAAEAEQLWQTLDQVDRVALFSACLLLNNRGTRVDDLGKGSTATRALRL